MKSRRDCIADAYLCMAAHGYRPAAPGDGLGSVDLSGDELRDMSLLREESLRYADSFLREEDEGGHFFIGVTNYATNRVAVLLIEAARLLCSGMNDKLAEDLTVAALQGLRDAAH